MQEQDIEKIRHSLAHLLAMAVKEKYPDAKLGMGPAIDNGFYYDFDFESNPPTEENLNELEKSMRSLVSKKIDFTQENITIDEAKKIILESRKRGYDNEFIKNLFVEKGWPLKLIDELLK